MSSLGQPPGIEKSRRGLPGGFWRGNHRGGRMLAATVPLAGGVGAVVTAGPAAHVQ
jgi:hypothetical protein